MQCDPDIESAIKDPLRMQHLLNKGVQVPALAQKVSYYRNCFLRVEVSTKEQLEMN